MEPERGERRNDTLEANAMSTILHQREMHIAISADEAGRELSAALREGRKLLSVKAASESLPDNDDY